MTTTPWFASATPTDAPTASGRSTAVEIDEQRADRRVERVLHQLAEVGRFLHRGGDRRVAVVPQLDRFRTDRDLALAVGGAAVRQRQRHRAERDIGAAPHRGATITPRTRLASPMNPATNASRGCS